MYLRDKVAAEGADLAQYRELLLSVLTAEELEELFSDVFGPQLGHHVNTKMNLTAMIQETLLFCARRGWLERLLAGAVRARAGNRAIVERLASALGLEAVVAVAELLAAERCPDALREEVVLAIDGTAGADRVRYHQSGCEAWLEVLVWLEERARRGRPRPLLLDFLERIEHAWRAHNTAGAARLRAWLQQQCESLGISARADAPTHQTWRGVLIELDTVAGWSFTAWLFGDPGVPLRKLNAYTVSAPEGEAAQREAMVAAVEAARTHGLVAPLIAAGVELRFEFALPADQIGMAVDQLAVGAVAGQSRGTRLGAIHPVAIRPAFWLRPQALDVRRRFENKRRHLRGAAPARIVPLDCPTQWTTEKLEEINEHDDIVAIALTCGAPTTLDPHKLRGCLFAHVLSIVWLRNGQPDRDVMERLLTPLPQAPQSVRDWRKGRGDNHDQLSLIWHVEPIELPALPLTSP